MRTNKASLLFQTESPSPDLVKAYDILLEMNGWDDLDVEGIDDDERVALAKEALGYLEEAEMVAQDLFRVYEEELADSLGVEVEKVGAKAESMALDRTYFSILANAQCVAEEIAWYNVRNRWGDVYPPDMGAFWDAVNDKFQEIRYEKGY